MNKGFQFFQDENGQGMIEYALIVALIAVVVIISLQFLGPVIKEKLGNTGNTIDISV